MIINYGMKINHQPVELSLNQLEKFPNTITCVVHQKSFYVKLCNGFVKKVLQPLKLTGSKVQSNKWNLFNRRFNPKIIYGEFK